MSGMRKMSSKIPSLRKLKINSWKSKRNMDPNKRSRIFSTKTLSLSREAKASAMICCHQRWHHKWPNTSLIKLHWRKNTLLSNKWRKKTKGRKRPKSIRSLPKSWNYCKAAWRRGMMSWWISLRQHRISSVTSLNLRRRKRSSPLKA